MTTEPTIADMIARANLSAARQDAILDRLTVALDAMEEALELAKNRHLPDPPKGWEDRFDAGESV